MRPRCEHGIEAGICNECMAEVVEREARFLEELRRELEPPVDELEEELAQMQRERRDQE